MREQNKAIDKPVEGKKEVPFNELVEALEKRIQTGDCDALEVTLQAIADAGLSLKDAGLRHRGISEAAIVHHYTRFASVITHVITTYEQGISLARYETICWRKQDISYIFAVSGYRGMAHLVNLCSSRNEDGSLSLKKNRALLLLAFLDIDNLTSELLDFAFTQDANILLPLMIGWLSQRAIMTERGENNRTKILQSGHLIETVQIEDRHLPMLSVAYMYVTYAVYPGKHEFKRSLNKLYRQLLERRQLHLRNIVLPKRKKPRLLVIHEWFSHSHAMYRCYAPLIEALGKKFELHSLASKEGIDDEAAKMFKSSTVVEPLKVGIPGILKDIERIKPDAIFYPSVGMAYWVILLSNLRLAPVQFATQGHPAPTRSKYIDFVFLGNVPNYRPDLYTEEAILGVTPSVFAPHKGLSHARPNPKYVLGRAQVDIAISAKLMKLNHQLFDVCKYLNQRSRIPLKFHFFPGERGAGFDGVFQSIKTHIANAEVYPLMQYRDLLDHISQCDFALSPMPFGNANGVVDCSLMGVPTLHCVGAELCSQTDAAVMTIFDGPPELSCKSIDEYQETALRLVHDLNFRAELRDKFSRDEIFRAIYERNVDEEFLEDITAIWRAFEKYKVLNGMAQ